MDYLDALSQIESGRRADALGPVTKTGDRAYGLYQVMGANIGPWTRAALGRELTPQQFLADEDAQRRTAQHVFGGYVNKYGPGGAARAWFAGPGGMNRMGAKDVLGTSVAGYEKKFMDALGGVPSVGETPTPSPVSNQEPSVASAFSLMYDPTPLTFQAQVPQMEQGGARGPESTFLDPAFAPRGARRAAKR